MQNYFKSVINPLKTSTAPKKYYQIVQSNYTYILPIIDEFILNKITKNGSCENKMIIRFEEATVFSLSLSTLKIYVTKVVCVIYT